MSEYALLAVPVIALALITVAAVAPRYLLPIMLVAGILLSPPSVVGERYPYIGPIVILVGALAGLLRNRKGDKTLVAPYVVLGLAGVWLLAHEVIRPGSEPGLIGNLTVGLLPALAFLLVARDRSLLEMTARVLVGAIVAVAALSVASMLLGAIVGFQRIQIGSVALGYARLETGILLPGALMYGDTVAGIPRLVGVGREPGMGAIYYVFAFFALPTDWKRRTLLRAVLVAALLTTQSTAGIGVFGVCWGLYYVFGRERFRPFLATIAAVAGSAIVWLAIYAPEFGLLAKSSSSVSVDERTAATLRGLSALQTNFWDASTDAPLSNLNLVASISAHGAPWAILLTIFLALPIFVGGRKNPLTYFSLFLAVTMLTSQPMAGSTAVFIFVVVATALGARKTAPSDLPEPGNQRGPDRVLTKAAQTTR